LNEEGRKQVKELGEFWSKLVADQRVPLPGAIYTSPLTRCLETTKFVFQDVFEQNEADFQPIIKERLRERLTDHTCDRRSSRLWIAKNFPDYIIELGFSEENRLWTGGEWETAEEHAARKQQALEDIFSNDSNHFVALTTHSYAISAILTVLGMEGFRMREGSSFAILVKVERIENNRE
jgi:broad specificity phosphatase PhoE